MQINNTGGVRKFTFSLSCDICCTTRTRCGNSSLTHLCIAEHDDSCTSSRKVITRDSNSVALHVHIFLQIMLQFEQSDLNPPPSCVDEQSVCENSRVFTHIIDHRRKYGFVFGIRSINFDAVEIAMWLIARTTAPTDGIKCCQRVGIQLLPRLGTALLN